MWNEISYKSSRLHLRKLPTKGPHVIYGPGENAGVIDIGDGDVCVFKMESHDHLSFIEPYQGAATGVGGILRDVFTMGARPVAALNLLRFGAADIPRPGAWWRASSGDGGYGNSFGVPTVGARPAFIGATTATSSSTRWRSASPSGTRSSLRPRPESAIRSSILAQNRTRRHPWRQHGLGGLRSGRGRERPTVQVGDPFAEKLLLEACLELMRSGAVIAIQDMGAAGLTSSAAEMGAKGDLGIDLDLDHVPCRETGMSAYEMMLSQSQERMLMVLKPKKSPEPRPFFANGGSISR